MTKNLRFPNRLIVLYVLLYLLPIVAFAADIDRQIVDSWAKKKCFVDLAISERLALLEKLAKQKNGECIFRASMDAFKGEVNIRLKEIDTRMDLKNLLNSFHPGELRFYASDKIKIRGDMVFKNCSLLTMVEQLCQKYQLKFFYYKFELYLIPAA